MTTMEELTESKPVPRLPPVSERVRLRKRYRKNQETMAKSLGISVRTFYRWETGKDITDPESSNHPSFRKYAELLQSWQQTERLENER
jgi:DNA-binding XRE family transcriptional regulator